MDYVVIAMACGIVLLLLLFRTKARFVLNFLVRAVLGVMLILFANNFLQKLGISLEIGVNAVTFLTAGSLGFPGVALLYAIEAVKFL